VASQDSGALERINLHDRAAIFSKDEKELINDREYPAMFKNIMIKRAGIPACLSHECV